MTRLDSLRIAVLAHRICLTAAVRGYREWQHSVIGHVFAQHLATCTEGYLGALAAVAEEEARLRAEERRA